MNLIKTLLLIPLLSSTLFAQSFSPFQAGDRVAFVGDSITHGGTYLIYVQTFYATRFPTRTIDMFNCGISGDQAQGGFQRASLDGAGFWASDIRRCKPNVATIMLGMNDVGGNQFLSKPSREALDEQNAKHLVWYTYNYNVLLDNLEKLNIKRIALIKSSPYDQTMINPKANTNLFNFDIGKNDAIVRLATEVIDAQSKRRGYPVIDFNTPMLEINQREQQKNPAFSIVGNDRIHPGSDGHMVMAYEFLKAQQLSGPVADTEIDAKGKAGAQFDYTATALPFPRNLYGNVSKLIPIEQEFNQERLSVKNLKQGRYSLTIDSKPIGKFGAKELAKGINLARFDTPQAAQAQAVFELCKKRGDANRKLRDVVWSEGFLRKVKGLDSTDIAASKTVIEQILKGEEVQGLPWKPSPYAKDMLKRYLEYADQFDKIQQSLETLTDDIYAAAQPVTRKIELTRKK